MCQLKGCSRIMGDIEGGESVVYTLPMAWKVHERGYGYIFKYKILIY